MTYQVNWTANPAWRPACTGDVLSGMAAGLLAQKLSPFDAASVAVYLHVAASELVSKDIGHTVCSLPVAVRNTACYREDGPGITAEMHVQFHIMEMSFCLSRKLPPNMCIFSLHFVYCGLRFVQVSGANARGLFAHLP